MNTFKLSLAFTLDGEPHSWELDYEELMYHSCFTEVSILAAKVASCGVEPKKMVNRSKDQKVEKHNWSKNHKKDKIINDK